MKEQHSFREQAKFSRRILCSSWKILLSPMPKADIKGAFFWDYSGIGILGIDGICVLLGAIPFSE